VDLTGEWHFTDEFTLGGVLSYVRGTNRDNDDNLYRIAPLHGTFALDHRWGAWESEIALVWADEQDEVAGYNDEQPTSGYAVLNVGTGYTVREHLTLLFGVENLLDDKYADHLGGINRVLESDVDVGEHIPNPGCFVYVSLRYEL
jgi:iron complex outermembrane receptor protein